MDLVKLVVMKRKLTKEESAKITKEVMAISDDPDTRFTMAVIKAVEATQKWEYTKQVNVNLIVINVLLKWVHNVIFTKKSKNWRIYLDNNWFR